MEYTSNIRYKMFLLFYYNISTIIFHDSYIYIYQCPMCIFQENNVVANNFLEN